MLRQASGSPVPGYQSDGSRMSSATHSCTATNCRSRNYPEFVDGEKNVLFGGGEKNVLSVFFGVSSAVGFFSVCSNLKHVRHQGVPYLTSVYHQGWRQFIKRMFLKQNCCLSSLFRAPAITLLRCVTANSTPNRVFILYIYVICGEV